MFLAAAKAGLVVAEVDLSVDSIAHVRETLKLSNCKAIVFDPITDTQDNMMLLRKSIPEFYHCEIFRRFNLR